MRKISLVLLMVMSGCTTGNPTHKSDWVVLDSAEAPDCAVWPLREKDLSISDIAFFPASNAFLVQGTSRNTSAFSYQIPFEGVYKVDLDEVGNIQIGRAAVVAGLSKIGSLDQVIVFEEKQGRTHVEFRSSKSNVIESSFVIPEPDLVPTGVFVGTDGVWISYKNEEQVVRFLFADPRQGKSIKAILSGVKLRDQPKIAMRKSDSALLLVTVADKSKKKFQLSMIDKAGQYSGPAELAIKATSQIESFSIQNQNDELFLAFIDGDSLVGESVLKLAKIGLTGTTASVRWTKVEPLRNVHVNEPLFVSSEKSLELLVLKWVDEESTIARYMVTADSLGKAKHFGVFQRGSRIMETMVSESSKVFTVTRSKGQDRWEYRFCRL